MAAINYSRTSNRSTRDKGEVELKNLATDRILSGDAFGFEISLCCGIVVTEVVGSQ